MRDASTRVTANLTVPTSLVRGDAIIGREAALGRVAFARVCAGLPSSHTSCCLNRYHARAVVRSCVWSAAS